MLISVEKYVLYSEISKFENFERIRICLHHLLGIVMKENDRHIKEIQENIENILSSMSKKCENLRKRLFEYYFINRTILRKFSLNTEK